MTSSAPFADPGFDDQSLANPSLADPSLIVHADDRLLAWDARALRRNRLFYLILALVLLAHAGALIYLFTRDDTAAMETAQLDETPVEVVIEPPREQPKPPPPPQKQPEPPKPKPEEQIEKPAFSAPRAPNKETVDTKSTDAKTQAPKAPSPPQQGVKAPPQQASKPQDENKDTAKEDAAAKPDEDKPDAEALDKAKPKVAPKAAAKPVTKAPLTKKTQDALASLSGESDLPNMTFAKPTPKAPVYGGTEDVRYLAIVQGLIMQKVHALPRLDHYQDGGIVAVYFHIDDTGRVISMEILKKSGIPGIDAMAMDAVRQASPFPAPPRGVPHGLVWGTSVDGQLPMRAMR